MLDLKAYREECSRLTLGEEKQKEIIIMAENTKKHTLGRNARMALVAAAVAAALGITVSAAEIPAVREFFTAFVTVTVKDGGDFASGINIPPVSVEERSGRTILLLDGTETDVTYALDKDGEYRVVGEGYEVVVDKNGVAVVTAYGKDGAQITVSTDDRHMPREGITVYEVTSDVETDAMQVSGMSTYNIVTDENGSVSVTDANQ